MASAYLDPVSRRRRAVAFALTVAVHLLVVWLLLHLPPRKYVPMADSGTLSAFDVAPGPTPAKQPQRRQAVRQRTATAPRPATPPPALPPIPFKDTSGVIWLTKDQYAKTDVSRLKPTVPSTSAANASADAGAAAAGAASGDSRALAGMTGPNGETLYAAQWYREPTNAELRTYLPSAPPDSWGMIACRTIAAYHVENCQLLGDSPPGSQIATGMRRAAWQFLVVPPRLGGKAQVGTWVRIKITFSERGFNLRGNR